MAQPGHRDAGPGRYSRARSLPAGPVATRGPGRGMRARLPEARAGAAHRHILHLVPDQPSEAVWAKLGAEPGLCRACTHAKLNQTRRGTAYVRCTRAAWDAALPRYPRLPITQCTGFERR